MSHPVKLVDRIAVVLVGVMVFLAALGTYRALRHTTTPAVVVGARVQDAHADTVFITDTLRLAASLRNARESTDGLFTQLPPTVPSETLSTDSRPPTLAQGEAICFPLIAFHDWQSQLRDAIVTERAAADSTLQGRDVRIADLQRTVTKRTEQWETALRRRDVRVHIAWMPNVTDHFRSLVSVTVRAVRLGPIDLNVGLVGAP